MGLMNFFKKCVGDFHRDVFEYYDTIVDVLSSSPKIDDSLYKVLAVLTRRFFRLLAFFVVGADSLLKRQELMLIQSSLEELNKILKTEG